MEEITFKSHKPNFSLISSLIARFLERDKILRIAFAFFVLPQVVIAMSSVRQTINSNINAFTGHYVQRSMTKNLSLD